MNATYKIVLAVVVGGVLGGAIVQGLRAQASPKAFLVTESSEVLDEAAFAAYVPQAEATVKAAGGRPGVISSMGGKIVAVVGEAPKRYLVSEWDGLAKLQAWLNSSETKALRPLRDKAFKTRRQFIIEAKAN